MLAIASAISAFFDLLRTLLGLQSRAEDRRAGAAEAILKGEQEADAKIDTANKARNAVESELTRDPSRLRDDDEFLRPD